MKSLFLDTSSFFVTVALIEDDKVLYLKEEEIKDDMSSRMMPMIRDAFNNVSFKADSIDKIFVVNGPGSFTGVRIGVTIAKVLAWSLKKDIITISSLEYLATTNCDTDYIIPMIDARRSYVYAGVYNNNLEMILKDQYIKYDDLKDYFTNSTIISIDELPLSKKPNLDVLKIVKKHLNDTPLNCHSVNPNYLKITEAEANLRSKQND